MELSRKEMVEGPGTRATKLQQARKMDSLSFHLSFSLSSLTDTLLCASYWLLWEPAALRQIISHMKTQQSTEKQPQIQIVGHSKH